MTPFERFTARYDWEYIAFMVGLGALMITLVFFA